MDAGAALRKFFGGLLMAIGGLMALTCGLCTGYFGILSVIELFQNGASSFSDIAPVMLIGLLATIAGIAMVWGGIQLMRDKPMPPTSP